MNKQLIESVLKHGGNPAVLPVKGECVSFFLPVALVAELEKALNGPEICPILKHAIAFMYAENLRKLWLAQADALADGKTAVEIVEIAREFANAAREPIDGLRDEAVKKLFPNG